MSDRSDDELRYDLQCNKYDEFLKSKSEDELMVEYLALLTKEKLVEIIKYITLPVN